MDFWDGIPVLFKVAVPYVFSVIILGRLSFLVPSARFLRCLCSSAPMTVSIVLMHLDALEFERSVTVCLCWAAQRGFSHRDFGHVQFCSLAPSSVSWSSLARPTAFFSHL